MTHKLLVSTLLLSHLCSASLTLMASADDTSAPEKNAAYWQYRLAKGLCKEECLEATKLLGSDPSQTYHAADAYYQYFSHAPIQLDNPETTPETRARHEDALRIFGALKRNDKLIYRDTYASVMRWHLKDEKTTPYTLLSIMDEFREFGFKDDVHTASQLYVNHPNKGPVDMAYPFKAAFAYDIAGQKQKASILFTLGLKQPSQDVTVRDVRKAALHFMGAKRYEKGLETYRQMFASFPHEHSGPADFLNAASCATRHEDYESASDFLTSYFEREMGSPLPLAYRLRATCATHSQDFETAKEYWLLAIKGDVNMFFCDYANAAGTFTELGDHDLAATYWKKALSAGDTEPDYDSYASACLAAFQVCDYETALVAADGMLARRGGEHFSQDKTDDLCLAAMAYSHNQRYDKSLNLWARIAAQKPLDETAYLWSGNDLYALGDYVGASDAFSHLSNEKIGQHASKDSFIETLVFCHLAAGKNAQAQQILTRFRGKGPSAMRVTQGSKNQSRSPKNAQEISQPQRNLRAMKVVIGTSMLAQMDETIARLKSDSHETLVNIEQKMRACQELAKPLLAQLNDATSQDHPPVSQDSSTSSSSSSSTRQEPSPFEEIQKLAREVDALGQQYKKAKSTLDRLAAKESRKQMIAQAIKEEPTLFYPSAPLPEPKAQPQKRHKKKTRGKADTAKKGASTSSSASTPAVNASKVEWRLTPTAQKHLSDLRSVPGFQGKFEAFRREIEMEPWGRRGNALTHASGRAKLLKGYDNVFSRRFSKGDRFFYRVERQEGARPVVTILGLMGHDL
ncbi:MAG: hypothetical protein C0514_01265 [Candidatus Puniceispirillum sp.]|nr:hypothetical protein [Candidatus Puniceispirillum sp.]